MKKITLSLALSLSAAMLFAQSSVKDQNPHWRESMEKYISEKSTHSAAMNTTVQDTYKAYDWTTAREERRADRRNFRRQRNFYNNSWNNGWGYNQYYSPYNNYYNNGWNNGWGNNYNGWNRGRGWSPFCW